VKCPTCHGTGEDPKAKLTRKGRSQSRYTSGGPDRQPPCPTCHGAGEIDKAQPQTLATGHRRAHIIIAKVRGSISDEEAEQMREELRKSRAKR
jgi:RecJ-like exonuclease